MDSKVEVVKLQFAVSIVNAPLYCSPSRVSVHSYCCSCPSLWGTATSLVFAQWFNNQLLRPNNTLVLITKRRTLWLADFPLHSSELLWAQVSSSHLCALNPSASCNSAISVWTEKKMIVICPVKNPTWPRLVFRSIISSTLRKLLFWGDYVHTQSDTYNHHNTKMDPLSINFWCTKHLLYDSTVILHHCSTNLECCSIVLYHDSLWFSKSKQIELIVGAICIFCSFRR